MRQKSEVLLHWLFSLQHGWWRQQMNRYLPPAETPRKASPSSNQSASHATERKAKVTGRSGRR